MGFYIFFFCVICVALFVVTMMKKDLFPFSYYPMYSVPHSLDKISVFRIALKKLDGSSVWWKSEFYRYPEYSGRKLKQLWGARSGDDKKEDVFLKLERNRLLTSILQIIEKEEGNISNYTAFCIVERRMTVNLEPVDYTVEIIPLSNLRDELF